MGRYRSTEIVERKLTKVKRIELESLKVNLKKAYDARSRASDRIFTLKDQIFDLEFKEQRIIYDTVYTPNERQLDTRIDAMSVPERVRLVA